MTGQFRKVGKAPFFGGSNSEYDVYEWTSMKLDRLVPLKIRFRAVEGPGYRTYWMEPLWLALEKGEPCQFLEQACSHGYKVLSMLDPEAAAAEENYRLCRALFRNRHAGHIGIRRHFQRSADFLDFPGDRKVSVIVPGFGLNASDEEHRGYSHWEANAQLLKAMAALRIDATDNRPLLRSIVQAFTHPPSWSEANRFPGTTNPFFFRLDRVAGRSDVDLLFTDGLNRTSSEWDWGKVVEKVRSALIYGPNTSEDQAWVGEHRDWFGLFINKIKKAMKRPGKDFDKWLKDHREHGFCSLLPGEAHRFHNEEASLYGRRFYCALMWAAYQLMARCWGALMSLVLVDLTLHRDDGDSPTGEEIWLFRQRYFPQLYLAGLPLAFLDRTQLCWVMPGLQCRWHDGVVASEHYDALTNLLGSCGAMVRNRRDADRVRKRTLREESLDMRGGDDKQGRSGSLPDHRGVSPGMSLENTEQREMLADALKALPADQREVVLLRIGFGSEPKDYEQIAQELRLPIQEVKQLERAAQDALRERLSPPRPEEEPAEED